jgi:hypothetical protein
MPVRIAIVSLAVTLSACVSSEVVYQRSLAALHLSAFARHLPRSEFEQIARVLSHATRQSIVDIHPGLTPNQLVVDTAYPNPTSYLQYGQFIVEKLGGDWHVVSGSDYPVPVG